MSTVLITGGSGFFGGMLKRHLLAEGFTCVNIDLVKDEDAHKQLTSIQGDIRNIELLEELCTQYQFDAIFHCAALLAHAVKDKQFLWESNVDGTRNIAECAKRHEIPKIIFTSSSCLWGNGFERPVTEEDGPKPVETYGKSKWEAEKILQEYADSISVIIFRCPTIIDEGRLGLLSILFEFIDEGKKVWVVGGGQNRFQFISGKDLIDACIQALEYRGSQTFNIGSDDVKPFRDVYKYVISKAETNARVASLPVWIAIPAMKITHALKISPLGPYQYKMIHQNFEFDTARIKQELNWSPTLTNEEMLWKAYNHYHKHKNLLDQNLNASAHRQKAKMGIIRLLKWIS